MLPARNRLRRTAEFSSTVRSGSRARSGRVVVLHHAAPAVVPPADAPRVGLIVSKSVGGSVIRHRVSRRLRAQLGSRLHLLEPGTTTVVRALPTAAAASSADLGADLDRALRRLAGPR